MPSSDKYYLNYVTKHMASKTYLVGRTVLTSDDINNLIELTTASLETYFSTLTKNSRVYIRGLPTTYLSEDYRNAVYDDNLLKKLMKEVPKLVNSDIVVLSKLYDILSTNKPYIPSRNTFSSMIPNVYDKIAKAFPHLTYKDVIIFEKKLKEAGKLPIHNGVYTAAARNLGYSIIHPIAWTCCPHIQQYGRQRGLGFVTDSVPPAWRSVELKVGYKCPKCKKNHPLPKCNYCDTISNKVVYVIKSVSQEVLEVQLINSGPFTNMFSNAIEPRPDSGCATSKKMMYYSEISDK